MGTAPVEIVLLLGLFPPLLWVETLGSFLALPGGLPGGEPPFLQEMALHLKPPSLRVSGGS